MDNFNEIYQSMFQNKNNQIIQNNSQTILDKLLSHIEQLIMCFDDQMRQKFIQYFYLIKSQNYDIKNFISINCIDQIQNKYELILKNLKTQFYVLHNTQLQNLKKDVQYTNGFYCGDFSKEPTSEVIYISLKPIKFKKSYLIKKRKQIQEKKKIQSTDFSFFQPKQQTINDVFLQYIGYFRNR